MITKNEISNNEFDSFNGNLLDLKEMVDRLVNEYGESSLVSFHANYDGEVELRIKTV
jgi:hypothetical protein